MINRTNLASHLARIAANANFGIDQMLFKRLGHTFEARDKTESGTTIISNSSAHPPLQSGQPMQELRSDANMRLASLA